MTGMPWLPYENDDFCIGSIQYSLCNSCGLMPRTTCGKVSRSARTAMKY